MEIISIRYHRLLIVSFKNRKWWHLQFEKHFRKGTKKPSVLKEGFVFCDPAGTRTQDPNIKSVVLYQLSYGIFHQ